MFQVEQFLNTVTTAAELMAKTINPANSQVDSSASPSDEKISETLRQLDRLWKTYRQEGLILRHETGRKLVDLIGPPSNRQAYGAEILKQVCKQIGVSRSEVSRMRKFANAYPDLKQFQHDHSECTTWTKVKSHLATIDDSGRPVPEKENEAEKAASPVNGVCSLIKSLTKKVQGFEANSTPEDRKHVIDAFETLAQAVRDTFGVTILVETKPNSDFAIDDSQMELSQAA